MKNLIVAIGLLMLSGCAALDKAADADQPIEFVIDAPGKTKTQLFSTSKSWIAETFVSGKDVVDDADKESGRIIAKGRIKHPCVESFGCGSLFIGFTLRIDTKDEKLRATFTRPTRYTPYESGHFLGLTYIQGVAQSESPITTNGDLADAKAGFKVLSEELKGYIINESPASKSW